MCNPIYVGTCSLWLQREGEQTEGRAGGRGGGPLASLCTSSPEVFLEPQL